MWAEKPNYTQLDFVLLELGKAVGEDPGLGDTPVYRAILDGDKKTLAEMGLEQIGTSILDLFAGITPEEFNAKVASFFANEVHPGRKVPYRQQRYQPMLELMESCAPGASISTSSAPAAPSSCVWSGKTSTGSSRWGW
jgi:hypothetical protein